MGLLDDVPKQMPSTGRRTYKGFVRDDHFEELQNLGHKENSKDFSDSPFADRRDDELKEWI